MSTRTSEEQQKKYDVEYNYLLEEYRKNDDPNGEAPSLPDLQELSISFQNEENRESVFAHYNDEKVQITINSTSELITIECPSDSIPLHVHIIELFGFVCNLDEHESDVLFGHKIFVIFNNRILRLQLENNKIIDCQIDNSNPIMPMSRDKIVKSLIVKPDSDETEEPSVFIQCFKVYLVLDIGGGSKVFNSSNLYLTDRPKSFSRTNINFSIKLPEKNLTEFDISIECSTIVNLDITLLSDGKFTYVHIYIYDGKNEEAHDDPIFILKELDRCILARIDQLERFQRIHFNIVATMYVCSHSLEEKPEINDFIKELLVLNKHRRSQLDSDGDSDSDSE
jgi:hypothetical protein